MKAYRYDIILKPDMSRVLYRPFQGMPSERILKIVARVQTLSDDEVVLELAAVVTDFHQRHQKLLQFFSRQYEQLQDYIIIDQNLTDERKLLIGAYFTQEYSLESAALFNPSMIWSPDQEGVPNGSKRFIISLRATGEGHISSITFRSGLIDEDYNITMDPASPYVTAPEISPNLTYERKLFHKKLSELGLIDEFSESVLSHLEDTFSLHDLKDIIEYRLRESARHTEENQRTAHGIESLAYANYMISFDADQNISERTVFPSTQADANGIEDARFVQFCCEDGSVTYYATYTAYDGRVILPQILETKDFLTFKINTLNGPAVQNKGMALFPRRINGKYTMVSRQDNENIYIMHSDSLHFWYNKKLILKPAYSWEFIQLGNCGSPIETERGWLVLSHGVGAMRKYTMGAFLLDLDDPTRVIGRTKDPILTPNENEREGYVPNVVYSCGAQIFNGRLIIPYALSDYASTFASMDVNELLDEIEKNPVQH